MVVIHKLKVYNDNNMDIKQMEYLLKIYETNNLTDAAEKLFISPQALSKVIKNIEKEYGKEIIVRHGNRFRFSDFGSFLVAESRKMLSFYSVFENRVDNFKKMTKESIYIDCPINTSMIVGYIVFNDFLNNHPEYDLIINEYDDFLIDNRIMNDVCDIALSVNDIQNDERFERHLLKRAHFGVIVSNKHPLASRHSLNLEDVTAYPLISRNEDYKSYFAIEEVALKKHLKLHYCLRTSDALATMNMIKDNNTIAFVIDLIEKSDDYIYIPLNENITWELYLTIKKSRLDEKKIALFKDFFLNNYEGKKYD